MKALLLSLVPLIIIAFGSGFENPRHQYPDFENFLNQDSISYKVYKIDSINDYFIIYAKKGKTVYKIVSRKEKNKRCNQITINHIYKFHLNSMLSINGKSIIPPNQKFEISGWRIDKSTTVAFEGDSIRDLFLADNIKGLCLDSK